MYARVLAIVSVASLAVVAEPSAARAQRVDSRDCTTRTEWRDYDACMRRRDRDIAPDARRSAARASANEARTAARRAEAAARVERMARAHETARIERVERDRARAIERANRRRSYTRSW